MAFHRRVSLAAIPWFSSCIAYTLLRDRELERIAELSSQLATAGFVEVQGVPPQEKRRAWERVVGPSMEEHWRSKFEFDLPSRTWPRPPTGKVYSATSTETFPGLPKLAARSYEAQAVLAHFVDPGLGLAHFGERTHPLLKLLVSPLWLLSERFAPDAAGSVALRGEDQSWHITSFPDEGSRRGAPKPENAHFDGGRNSCYTRTGVPGHEGEEPRARLIRFALKQLAILFYCETPGELGPEHGATGVYGGSHRAMYEAAGRSARRGENVEWPRHVRAVRALYGEGGEAAGDLEQPVLREGKMILVLGTLVHTACWGQELMEGGVRVIQNAKVHAESAEDEKRLVELLLGGHGGADGGLMKCLGLSGGGGAGGKEQRHADIYGELVGDRDR